MSAGNYDTQVRIWQRDGCSGPIKPMRRMQSAVAQQIEPLRENMPTGDLTHDGGLPSGPMFRSKPTIGLPTG